MFLVNIQKHVQERSILNNYTENYARWEAKIVNVYYTSTNSACFYFHDDSSVPKPNENKPWPVVFLNYRRVSSLSNV